MKLPKEFTASPVVAPSVAPAVAPVTTTDVERADPPVPATEEEISRIDISWLPFAAKTYHISPRLEDYVIVNMMICPSNIPNRNGIGFPTAELVAFQPPPMNRQVYKAWVGCPVHEEHDNEDCTKAVGVIFDTSFRLIKNFGDGNQWAVYGLIGVDRTKFPELAAAVAAGRINTGSMGTMADSFTCSVCGHEASKNPMLNCNHIISTDKVNWHVIDVDGVPTLAFLNAHQLSPIEFSIVRDPAWATCLSDTILST